MISVGVIFFNQPEMLKIHLKEWSKYRDHAEFIVIDDCSSLTPVLDVDFVKVYRIIDDIPWNQTGARNLLYHVASNNWVLSTDCDHVVTRETFDQVLRLSTDDDLDIYFLNRVFSHGLKKNRMHSSFYCNRHTFLAAGGHDEDLAGNYGGVDQSWEQKVRDLLNYHWCDDICVECHSANPKINDASVINLDRNPKKNMELFRKKLKGGQPRGEILRFRWERVV